MRRVPLRWLALAITGAIGIVTAALLGAPDVDAPTAPSVVSTTTAAADADDAVRRSGLSQLCTDQLGGRAEAVWLATAWSCAGTRRGLWAIEPLALNQVCSTGRPIVVDASGVDCGE